MRRTLLAVLIALPLMAQRSDPTFTGIYQATKSSAAGVTSLQQPSAPTKMVILEAIQLYCSVACIFTLDAGGAASGSTSSTTNTDPSKRAAATALLYNDSNASAATTAINVYPVAAGQTLPVYFTDITDKSRTVLSRTAGQNITLRTNSITGDVKVTWMWREQ